MKNYQFKWLLLSIILSLASITTAGAYTYTPTGVGQQTVQSQQVMQTGGAYKGTVYTPFSGTTPSQQSVPSASRSNGPRRVGEYPGWHQNENGEWVPDNVEEYEETGGGVEIDRSSQSPVGEPWVMALFALAFAGVIAIRQYKRKKAESMNMKNSTSKFIATLVLLCTLSVGQMWAGDRYFDGDEILYIKNIKPTNWGDCWAKDASWKLHVYLFKDGGDNTGIITPSVLLSGTDYQLNAVYAIRIPKGTYTHIILIRNSSASWGGGQTSNIPLDESKNYITGGYTTSSDVANWDNFTMNFKKGQDLYLKSNTNWRDASAKLQIYFWDGDHSEWMTFPEKIGSTDYHKITIPSRNWPYAKIVRRDKDTGDSWSNIWNSTNDIQSNSDATKNCIILNNATNVGTITWETVYAGLSVSRNIDAAASAPAIGQTFIASGSSVSVTAQDANTGYHWTGWESSNGTFGNSANQSTTFFPTAQNAVAQATYALNTYTVTFDANGGTGDTPADQTYTHGEAQTLNANTFTRTGYNFDGWAKAANGDVVYTNEQSVTNPSSTNTHGDEVTLYAHWTAMTCDIALDYQTGAAGYGDDGSITEDGSLTATYDAAMTDLTGTMPTGTNGYRFQGFYSETGGKGTKYYDKDGSSAHTWDVATEEEQTLYAFYEKDTISSLELSATVVHPWVSDGTKDSITVTPETLLVPDLGTVIICYSIEYSNGDSYDQSSTIFDNARVMGGNSIKFRAPISSGSYRLKAELKTTNCSGTLLDTKYANFVVVSPNTITIRYLCDNVAIKESTSASINALDSVSVEAPTIEGYTFSEWEYSAGITSASADNVSPKNFVASAPGTIKAKYVETPTVFFYNNLGWSEVYVTYDPYWDGTKEEATAHGRSDGNDGIGAGNKDKVYHKMTRIAGTNVWYDIVPSDFTDNGFKDWAWNVMFNNCKLSGNGESEDYTLLGNYKHFNTGEAVFRYDFDPQNTMFVPTKSDNGFNTHGTQYRSSTSDTYSSAGVHVHNNGYWKKYHKKNSGYSLRGTFAGIVEGESNWVGTNHNLVSTNEEDSVFSTTLKLNANSTYYFRIFRNNRNYEKGDKQSGFTSKNLTISYSSNRTNNEFWTNKDWVDGSDVTLNTATEGEYTFTVTFKNNGRMVVDVDYPDNVGDFQVMYKDTKHTKWHPTSVVLSEEGTKATTSFFVRNGKSPQMQWRKITGVDDDGTIEWSTPTTVNLSSYTASGKILDASATGVDTTGVYNFIFDVSDVSLTLSDVQKYNGEYYIRTNSASSWKWQHYLESEHHMTYSDYADAHSGYSHYFMKYVGSGTNVKFVVANPYSPCISDTLGQGTQTAYVDGYDNLRANANIRYSWNMHDNSLNRAYVGMVDRTHTPRQATKFIVLQGESGKLKDKDGYALNSARQGTMYVGDDAIEFDDDENWIYEQTVQAVPGGRVKIYSHVDGVDEENDQYLIGDAPLSGDGAWVSSNSDILIDGTGGEYENIRVIFDFKTNRLMAAWVPAAAINTPLTVQADIMILRTHQGSANHIDLTGTGRVTLNTGKTVYGVMRFNKYVLNNLQNRTSTPLDEGDRKTIYERSNYYISFPFKVSVRDIFGFGSYGPTWTLRYYDGKGRAKNGFWADSDSFWKYVAPFDTLQANQGYLLTLNMNKFTTDQEVWNNGVENIELYFPAVGAIDIQQVTSFDIDSLKVADYKSTINRGEGTDGDRRIKDSFWRCIGVPSFATIAAEHNDDAEYAMNWDVLGKDLPFLYQVNWNTNGLTVVNTTSFTFQPMHAYMVQNGNLIRWRNIVRPASVVARQSEVESITFELELSQEGNKIDHTYIRLTDNENVTADFDFGQDLSKEFNPGANIYTKIGYEQVAANVMPLSNTTTMVPVGLKIAEEGEYTFAMPEGTNGVSVILIDNIAGTRTNLALTDYTVYLTAGTHDERFILEISPMAQTPTDIEQTSSDSKDGVRKVMVDGVLYILRDGQVFDARGQRVE